MSPGMGGLPHGGPGMGLPGLSESLLSMQAQGFPGGGMGGPASSGAFSGGGMGMGGPMSAAAALGVPYGPSGKRARTSEKGSYASSIAGEHAGSVPVGRRSDYVFDDYSISMHAHAAMVSVAPTTKGAQHAIHIAAVCDELLPCVNTLKFLHGQVLARTTRRALYCPPPFERTTCPSLLCSFAC